MQRKHKKINLALQGGGTHAAFAWGVIDWLLQDGRITIDSVSSASAGTVNAIVLAQGLIEGGAQGARDALFKFWQDVSEYGKSYSPLQKTPWEEFYNIPDTKSLAYTLFLGITNSLSPYQFNPMNQNILGQLLEKHIDFEKIKNSEKIKLFLSATNVQTGKIKVFDNHELCVEAVLASTCLPNLFQAVEIDGEHYWDGGFMGNPPIFPLIYHSDTKDILILHINPIVRHKIPTTIPEIQNRINEISFNSSLMREMRAIAFITQMLEEHWVKDKFRSKIKKVNIHSVRSDHLIEHFSVASKLRTDWSFINYLFKKGQKSAKAWLSMHYDDIGKKSSIDLNEFL